MAWNTQAYICIYFRQDFVVGRGAYEERHVLGLGQWARAGLDWFGLGLVWFNSGNKHYDYYNFLFRLCCRLCFGQICIANSIRVVSWVAVKSENRRATAFVFGPFPYSKLALFFPLSWPLMRFDLGLANIPGTKYLSRLRPAFNWPDQVWPSPRLQPTCWKVPKRPQRKMYFWFIKLHECQHHQRDRLKNKRPTKCYLHLAKLP